MDINRDLTLNNVPVLEDLLGIELDPNTCTTVDPLGYDNYSFFEYCNIDKSLMQQIDREVEFETLMSNCINEGRSVNWLMKAYCLTESSTNKWILLQIASEEYKHSLIYFNLIKLLYPEKNTMFEYNKLKDYFVEINFWAQFDTNDFDMIFFQHFISESVFVADLKYQYKMTTNPLFKQCMKQIFVEETRHVALSRQMQLDWSAEKKEKLKRVVLLKIKQILNNGIGVYNPQKYLAVMEERGIKLKDLLPDMKKSKRAKDFTTSTVLNMFKSARDMKLIPEDNIDQFLINNNLQEKYNKFL